MPAASSDCAPNTHRARAGVLPRHRRGIALLIMGTSILLVIPIVGLAIDASFLYMVKARLSAAADAAALAAARNLNVGISMADQEVSARNRATAFFNANFPDNYLRTENKSITVSVAETGTRVRTVRVDASVIGNTWFMRYLGFDNLPINTTSTASRRDVNLILVLDRSGSMQNSSSCEPMKSAAQTFVNGFANERDRIGMISFGQKYSISYAYTKYFKNSPTLTSTISQITCYGGTSSAMALWNAYQQLVAINEQGALNILVFFTDGLPNGITASYPIKTLTDTRYGYGVSPYTNTNTLYSMPPSTCQDASGRTYPNASWAPQNREGTLSQAGSTSTGNTWGLYDPTPTTINGTESGITGALGTKYNDSGCTFSSGNLTRVRRDIAYIPTLDIFGNKTDCCYQTAETFTSGNYNGKIRPDKPTSIMKASANAVDDAAKRIRSNNTLYPIIYTIGLGDAGGSDPPDETLMKRIANDRSSPVYDSTQQTGMYAFAPDKAALSRAFAMIASEILRISQ